ncbi:MAG: N-acetyl-1-D-myo-inositol-2-amino-2-deoxy-alpha-D-glucopyranoside deacetylase [Nocardioides sp.]|uniref:N-acetyl-1-D-myo-inositol-2-amino-2-deoxy-alpha- D-glucopyranoside deacetylase n=1 Tax=Nocardioides sp. TaxID=35761 RepID=UPI0039E5BD94
MSTPDKRLLLMHAHPDDESIGNGATMARYVSEGVGVTLVTSNAGERGEVLVPELEHLAWGREDALGPHRRDELAAAMKALGVTDHRFLGGFGAYSDSGMAWHEDGHAVAAPDTPDNAFSKVDLTEAADQLVAIIREVRPQVLVTYDQFGGYGHPDHIQAHRVGMYAAQLAGVPSYRRDLGDPWTISKVYWNAMAWSGIREGIRAARAEGAELPFGDIDPDGPPPWFAVEDDAIAAQVDGTAFFEQKMDALRAHATQIAADGPFFSMANSQGASAFAIESYRLAVGTQGPVGPGGFEEDLFAGL